ncbi:MAG: ABC transporter permease [Chloroflexi bacterium]|nr:ABC transporter permease [Chloroflexota bacterium]
MGTSDVQQQGHQPHTPPTHVIKPSRGWFALNLRELWAYRELLYFFIWRDIKVRYKQTVVGAAWVIIQPFSQMVIFSVVFGHLADLPSDEIPYPVFTYTALVPWIYFANSLTNSSNAVVDQARVITKVYFPRVLLPAGGVIGGLLDFGIAFLVLIGMMLYFGISPGWAILTLPLFLLLAMATALAVGLWLSALNAVYRDVRYALTFLIQFWMFATPVAYSSGLIPDSWKPLYGINPMAGVVDGFRWALLGKAEAPGPMLAVSAAVVVLLLVTGALYFKRMERYFADIV